MLLRRDPGRGERRSVTGSAALRGVPTLGGINTLGGSTLGGGNHGGGPVGEITKVSGGAGLGVWRGGGSFVGFFLGMCCCTIFVHTFSGWSLCAPIYRGFIH